MLFINKVHVQDIIKCLQMWYYFTNVCNLISIQPVSLYLHMKRDTQFVLSGWKENSYALTTFHFSWSRFCGKRKQSSLWMCPGRFYIIGNCVLLKGNCILVFPIWGRKKTSIWSISCILYHFSFSDSLLPSHILKWLYFCSPDVHKSHQSKT